MSKAEESIKAMKDYFFKLPHDPNFRVNEMGVWDYLNGKKTVVSEISLGQRCSALMKALNYHINSECRDHGEATDWVTHHKVYPKKILDTAFWFITEGKFKTKIAPKTKGNVVFQKKICDECGKEFVTKYSWSTTCLPCHYAEDKVHLH